MSYTKQSTCQEEIDTYTKYQGFLKFVQQNHPADDQRETKDGLVHQLYKVAPLFTTKVHAFALQHFDTAIRAAQYTHPQYGLLGTLLDGSSDRSILQNLVFGNTSEPWSAFICGSQGSGKSHTLSCLLENALLKLPCVSVTDSPAAGLVFHYDQFSSVSNGQICEAAYLCSAGVPVTILVCPTSLSTIRKRYEKILCQYGGKFRPRVMPLYLKDEQLSTEIMMTLMAIDDVNERSPLYISSIRQLLRQMISDKPDHPVFDYKDFIRRLQQLSLTKEQLSPLNLRLELLKSVLLSAANLPYSQALYDDVWQPGAGSLTIIDLSDPFITASDACALFSISLKLFIGGWGTMPRMIALDEAHKFLRSSTEAQKLSADLISVIRQQRHLGARVIVSTQEPTISSEFLALCNVSIVHRFTSPEWYSTLRQQLIGAHKNNDNHSLLPEIAGLGTGQALIFCPTAILDMNVETGVPKILHDTYFKLAVRNRASADGGKSVLPEYDICNTAGSSHDDNTSTDFAATEEASDDGVCLRSNINTDFTAMAYKTRAWRESELEDAIYNQIRMLLGPKPVKDPWPVVVRPAFKALEMQFAVPERFFADNALGTACQDRRPIDMMKRLLKKYYDELQVPRDQRAPKTWLRD